MLIELRLDLRLHEAEHVNEQLCTRWLVDVHHVPRIEDSRERVLAFLDHAVEAAGGSLLKPGCVLGSCALDFSEINPALRLEIVAQFDGLTAVLAADLAAALERSPVPGLDAAVLA